MKPTLEVVYLPLDELHDYESNAKVHDRGNIDAIKASIGEFGNCDPIGVWTDENGKHVIVEGHGRRIALKELGQDTVPCILLNHLSDEQRRAYALAHNKTTLMTGFDVEILNYEMDALEDFDMSSFGFEEMGDFDFAVEDFGETEDAVGKDSFSMTFVFPIAEKGAIDAYVKDAGKEAIVNMIVEMAVSVDA